MGDEVTIDDGAQHPDTRRSRRESAERTMSEDSVVLEAGATGPTPEEALADAQAALANKDKETEEANARAAAAERTAAQARDQVARERAGRVAERQGAVESAVEAAKADKASAQAAIKAARDAGDLDAEMAANDKLASANFRLLGSQDELDRLKAIAEGGGGQQQRGDGGGGDNTVSPAAQAWINTHPKFKTDPTYRRAALAAHGQALLDGAIADSPAYFRYLDEAVAKLEGGNRDQRDDDMGDQNRDRGGRRESSEGAPPSRGSGGHGGASKQVKTPLGTLTVSRRSDGKLAIQIPPANRAAFEEGAKICNMNLGDYAYEQVKISDEIAAGGTGGLITEEGSAYR